MNLPRVAKIALFVVVALAAAFWYAFVGRAHATVDKDNWHLEWSYVRMACHTCSGQIYKLEFQGRPFTTPSTFRGDRKPTFVEFHTPVATLKWFPQYSRWRFEHASPDAVTDKGNAISAEELGKGNYELEWEPATTQPWSWPRKPGTPKSWILALSSNWDNLCWFDPARADTIKW